MVSQVKEPICVICNRGSTYNKASIMGNEIFILIPVYIQQGSRNKTSVKQWVIFCGKCTQKLLSIDLDLSNLITSSLQFTVYLTEDGEVTSVVGE